MIKKVFWLKISVCTSRNQFLGTSAKEPKFYYDKMTFIFLENNAAIILLTTPGSEQRYLFVIQESFSESRRWQKMNRVSFLLRSVIGRRNGVENITINSIADFKNRERASWFFLTNVVSIHSRNWVIFRRNWKCGLIQLKLKTESYKEHKKIPVWNSRKSNENKRKYSIIKTFYELNYKLKIYFIALRVHGNGKTLPNLSIPGQQRQFRIGNRKFSIFVLNWWK